MGWINTSYRFDDHSAVFVVRRTDLFESAMALSITALIDRAESNPSEIEKALCEMIANARPKLAGCMVWFLDFKADERCWEIGVIHPSLPPTSPMACPKRQPLFTRGEERSTGDTDPGDPIPDDDADDDLPELVEFG